MEKTLEGVESAIQSGDAAKAGGELTAFLAERLGGLLATGLFIAVLLFVTWLGVRLVKHFFKRLQGRLQAANNSSAALVSFASHIVVALIWFSGISAAIAVTPLEGVLNKLLAAGGVLAVVAGIASQEALGSMVSGLMILAFRPFALGDVIRYVDNDISGIVEEITLRHTVIRTWESKRVIVPNSKMNSAIIENADYGDRRVCVLLDINVTYESDLALAQTVLAGTIRAHPSFLDYRSEEERAADAPEVLVRVKELAESWVVLRAWLWAKDNGTAAAMKSDILQSAKRAFAEAGVELAYPHLVVVQK